MITGIYHGILHEITLALILAENWQLVTPLKTTTTTTTGGP